MLQLIPSKWIILAGGLGVAVGAAYFHGRFDAAAHMQTKLERLSNNYITLMANEKSAFWLQIGQERQQTREMLETVDRYFNAGASARASNQRELQTYLERANEAESQAVRLLNQLQEQRNEWAVQRVPNDYVCAVTDGVLNVDGCRGGRVARDEAEPDDSVEVLRPGDADDREAGGDTDTPGNSSEHGE